MKIVGTFVMHGHRRNYVGTSIDIDINSYGRVRPNVAVQYTRHCHNAKRKSLYLHGVHTYKYISSITIALQ